MMSVLLLHLAKSFLSYRTIATLMSSQATLLVSVCVPLNTVFDLFNAHRLYVKDIANC